MIRLTRAGQLVLAGAVAAVVAGRVLGLDEVTVLGGAALATVLLALAWVARPEPAVESSLRVEPPRVPAGRPAEAVLRLRNAGRRRCPELDVAVPVEGQADGDVVAVAGLAPGHQVDITVGLPTAHRGIVHVGPARAGRSDPFGLVRRSAAVSAESARLVVLPNVTVIAPVKGVRGDDPLATTSAARARTDTGEDFVSLRDYVPGDDLRRVHWPTSARTDDLVVRREERPWQRRCTVLVDVQPEAHAGGSLEPVVRAAASILAASARRGDAFRLVTTHGFDSGVGSGPHHLTALLDELAALEPAPASGAAGRHGQAADGTLVVLTTPWSTGAGLPLARGASVVRIDVADDADFAERWRKLMGAAATGTGRRTAPRPRAWARAGRRVP